VRLLHRAFALVAFIVLPAYSWHDGSGWLAWTMFCRSQTYRLRASVTDASGATHLVNPNELTALVDGETAAYLSGSDHWRHAPVGDGLRANLEGLARLACRTVPGGVMATFAIELRRTLETPVATTTVHTQCR
jgi:hypothetical protein